MRYNEVRTRFEATNYNENPTENSPFGDFFQEIWRGILGCVQGVWGCLGGILEGIWEYFGKFLKCKISKICRNKNVEHPLKSF